MPYSNIDKPNKYFDITLFTGDNASGRTFTGLNFPPDMIWGKSRDTASLNHQIVDIVRGGTKFIFPNSTVVEDTASHGQITSWNSDGTTWADGTNGTYPRLYYNDNGQLGGAGSRVWWQWKANGTGVSNTSGTISSTVSANTTSGFSIVSYTGNSSSATVGHGLGVAPKFIIIKHRNDVDDWTCYHSSLGASQRIQLNNTDGATSLSWGGSPTSSVFYLLGGGATAVNVTGGTYIAYCFAEVKGYSKFGSYTGNGSTDGTFVYTGFKPAFVLMKRSDSTSDWFIFDSARQPSNQMGNVLFPNLIASETGTYPLDFVSNGFKNRNGAGVPNTSGGTFIYMAFAENPFVSSKGIPTTAR